MRRSVSSIRHHVRTECWLWFLQGQETHRRAVATWLCSQIEAGQIFRPRTSRCAQKGFEETPWQAHRLETLMKALCLVLALLSLAAFGEDFVLADGTKFTGKVIRVDPDGLIVETAHGIEKLPYYTLTEADLKRFHLSTKTAEEFRLQQKQARA